MKYKVGDKVKIKSKEWFDTQEKDEDGNISPKDKESFVGGGYMSRYCGQTAIVKRIHKLSYRIDIDDCIWNWQDWMLENNTK